MTWYMIKWDAGCGESAEPIEAETLDEAEKEAAERWQEEANSQACHWAVKLTAEELENYGYDPLEYGLERTNPEDWN